MNISTYPSQLQFCDSAIIVGVTASDADFASGSTMRKVCIEVYDSSYKRTVSFEYDGAGEYKRDIQKAVRSLFDDDAFNPNNYSNYTPQKKSYSMVAYSTYMRNGTLYSGTPTSVVTCYAVRGRLTDMELKAGTQPTVLSRKPSEAEVMVDGHKKLLVSLVGSSNGGATGAAYLTPTLSSTEAKNIGNGVYIDKVQTNQYQRFIFINSLGQPESVCARTLEKKAYIVSKTQHDLHIDAINALSLPMHSIHTLSNQSYMQASMSSGACSRAWSRWWATEFITSPRVWVLEGGIWVPCRIKTNGVSYYDRSKAAALHIDFSIEYIPLQDGKSGVTLPDSCAGYGDGYLSDRKVEFKFINSNSSEETAYASTLESGSISFDKKDFERYASSDRDIISTISNRSESFKMSSGACSRELAQWFAMEFLSSCEHKIKIGGNYVPCLVTPDKNEVQIYDRSSASHCHVDFTVKLFSTL